MVVLQLYEENNLLENTALDIAKDNTNQRQKKFMLRKLCQT